MKKNFIFLIWLLACNSLVTAQSDSINWLQEVQLSDVKLRTHSGGQRLRELNDSIIRNNEPALTQLLKFNSPLFFRENGFGMVSSASGRGTGAAHTAVVWNGININSQLTGQTDFNTINTKLYDNISLKPGGGSVVYGSGAIGGSIHLNNEMSFTSDNSHLFQVGYGSFGTYEGVYKGEISNPKTNLQFGFSGITSENDYHYPSKEQKNQNGDFKNISFNLSAGRWLGEKNIIKFYSNYYNGHRGFSGTMNLESNSKFKDENFKNLLEWKSFQGSIVSSLKLALINEAYQYFENRNQADHSTGEANSLIAKYDLRYKLNNGRSINLITDFSRTSGEGSGISPQERMNGGVSILWKHALKDLSYELSLRQEINNLYDSPLLFSGGLKYQMLDTYSVGLNVSRNYRIPSFNDLFWLQGGNPDLEPEHSMQMEFNNIFLLKGLELGLTAFYIDLDQLIRWTPDDRGIWTPENTEEVYNYGLEAFVSYKPKKNKLPLYFSGNYAFTRSINKSTGKQLIYTPLHKANFTTAYNLRNLTINLKNLYHGSIYTSSDNEYELEDYFITNIGISYEILRQPELKLGAEFSNIFNTSYQSLPGRIMPGRSFKTNLTLNL